MHVLMVVLHLWFCGCGIPMMVPHNEPASTHGLSNPSVSPVTAPEQPPPGRPPQRHTADDRVQARALPSAPLASLPPPSSAIQLHPPEALCAEVPPEPSGALELESDSAPLTIKATANGVALDARGARAGRVLIELGRLAKRQIHVGGSGANVRIYAHISDLPWQKTFDAVLDGAGLRSKEGENRDWGRVLDVNDPAVIANRYRPVPCIDMDPPEVLLIRARHPEALAPVIARTLLRCGEMIIAAPERSVLLVEGNSATRYRVHKLMQALEAEHPVSYSEDNVPRGQTFTRFDIPALTCPGAGRPAAPNLPDGQLFSAGGAVGDLMRHLAVAASTDVVVGCGGDQHVAHVPSESNALKGTAYQSGLVGGDSLVYVSSEFFYARARAFEAARPGGQPPVSHPVRTFKVPFPAEFATAAEAMAPGLYATPFAPASMVLVWGDETGMKRVEALAEAWKQ